jgi:hypothetical protein
MTALDHVYRYRTLLGKCEAGIGLSLDEIEALVELESAFASNGDGPRASKDGRRFGRAGVELTGLLRGPGLNDRVAIRELSAGGLVLRQAPYVEEDQIVELVIDDPAEALSYRFKARVSWLREDVGDDFKLGLAFVGVPLLIHYGPTSDTMVDQIAA